MDFCHHSCANIYPFTFGYSYKFAIEKKSKEFFIKVD